MGFICLSPQVWAVCDANADKLVRAYPEHLLACKDNFIIWKDGTKQRYDDGKTKTFQQVLNNPDIEDMFRFPYPRGKAGQHPPQMHVDPGRIRHNAFFQHMYGKTQAEVRSRLAKHEWLPTTNRGKKHVSMTTVNGVDQRLKKVSAQLDALPKPLKKYVLRHAGTFNWRFISGTKRLSAHAFGIAIDIDTTYADYWKWHKAYRYHNQIPAEIVDIFEDNGFIWGGKWYHYDTMHFEYRPELLIAQ